MKMTERPNGEDWRPEGDQESNRDTELGSGSDVIGGNSGRAGGGSDVVGSDLGPDTGTATREPDLRGGEVY